MNLADVLRNWLASSLPAKIEPAPTPGFSGARVWKVTHGERQYALRRWPPAFPAARLLEIHELQQFLAARNLPVPAPLQASNGRTLVVHAGACYELADWRAGRADYRDDPRPEKCRAALQTLARIHRAAAEFTSTTGQGSVRSAPAPSLARRYERAAALLNGELAELHLDAANFEFGADDELKRLASESLALIAAHLPAVVRRLAARQSTPLPLQWRLGDVHRDHVLFTVGRVTGVIDFGAASVDAPAGDVSRLLGSLVGDDRPARRDALAAYEQIRPLSPAERDAVPLFDISGTVLASANWLHWLYVEPPHPANPLNRPAAVNRLRTLTARLRVLAAPPH